MVANNSTVDSNYCSAKIEGSSSAGSFISALVNDIPSGSNNYCAEIPGLQPLFSGTFAGVETKTEEEIKAICSPEAMGFTEENGWKIVDGGMHLAWENKNSSFVS